MAADKGFELFKDTYSQQASSGFAASMTQDTAEALEGRFTAIQINTASILASVIEIQSLIILQVGYLETISKNTKVLGEINSHLEIIEENTKGL